ncbi:MAG: hypothetical protein J3Q66DRAFT_327936 [Benniella sp.]|nr:MAG: hypothetical protein J3Q66DRAFT_327936 [Benniella sp.]
MRVVVHSAWSIVVIIGQHHHRLALFFSCLPLSLLCNIAPFHWDLSTLIRQVGTSKVNEDVIATHAGDLVPRNNGYNELYDDACCKNHQK